MSWLLDPSGATKVKARSSTGCRSRPISSFVSRAAITPATLWSSTDRLTNFPCCRQESCGGGGTPRILHLSQNRPPRPARRGGGRGPGGGGRPPPPAPARQGGGPPPP